MKICMTSNSFALSDFIIAILNMFIFVISLSTLLLSSAGLKNSLTPSYVKQFFTEWKTIMKCVSPPPNIFFIKPVHLWVENFWPSRERTLMWSANVSGSRKQSLNHTYPNPLISPCCWDPIASSPLPDEAGVCDSVRHLDSEVQAVILYSVAGLRFLNRDSTACICHKRAI